MIQQTTSGYLSKIIQNKILNRYVHTHVYFSTVHNSQEVETT